MRKLSLVALLAMAALTSGCPVPIPVVKTDRPESEIHVYAADQRPLPGARVVVMTHYAQNDAVWELQTDSNGIATLSREKSLGVAFPLMIHGYQTLSFMWCVEHPGYLPVAGSRADDEQMKRVFVQLTPGTSVNQCDPSDYFSKIGPWQELHENGRKSGNMNRTVAPGGPAGASKP